MVYNTYSDLTGYTTDSKAQLQDTLNHFLSVDEDADATLIELDQASNAVKVTAETLPKVADYTEGKTLQTQFASYIATDYTTDTWTILVKAMDAMVLLIDHENVTQPQFDTAVGNVKTAMDGLIKVSIPVPGVPTPIIVEETILKEIGITTPEVIGLDLAIMFTDAEIASGAKAEITLDSRTLDSIKLDEKALIDAHYANLKDAPKHVVLLDITLNKVVDGERSSISNANGMLEISFGLPTEFKTLTFHINRIHDGKVEVLPHTVVDGVVTYEADKFSTYGIVEGPAPLAAPKPITPGETLPDTGVSKSYVLPMSTMVLGLCLVIAGRERKDNY